MAIILPLVQARGVEVGGKDSIATLSARLSNAPEFKMHRGVGWWFANEAVPGAWSALLDETGEPLSKQDSPVSNVSTGGSEDAAALALDSDRE